MKVVFPKHIEKWLLAGLTFSVGPMSLSIVQLFIVAIWVAAGLGIFNSIAKTWSKAVWAIAAIPVLLIFIIVAFFKVSEMWLLAFVGKIVRNNFFDTTKKFQVNHERINSTQLIIQKTKTKKKKQAVIQKDRHIDQEVINQIEKGGLL